MGREVDVGISDDGQKFTVVEEDDENLENLGEEEEETEKDKEFFFDFDKVPEDQRDAFKETFGKMQESYKTKTKDVTDLQSKAALVNSLVDRVNALSSAVSQSQGVQPRSDVGSGKPAEEQHGLKFKFEEGDYYRPVFEELTGLVSGIKTDIEGLKGNFAERIKTDFQTTVKNFFSQNKVDKDEVVQMDNIAARMGTGVYNDLSALRKLARLELNKPSLDKKETVSIASRKRVGIKRQVESSSQSSRDIESKPVTSIREAFDKATRDLRNKSE